MEKNYLDVPFVEGEIESIYFGANANQKLINDLISIARTRDIEHFYRSENKIMQYGIKFTEI